MMRWDTRVPTEVMGGWASRMMGSWMPPSRSLTPSATVATANMSTPTPRRACATRTEPWP